jgi:TPR repeat protein
MSGQSSGTVTDDFTYDQLWSMTAEEWAKRVGITEADETWIAQFRASRQCPYYGAAYAALAEKYWKGDGVSPGRGKAIGLAYQAVLEQYKLEQQDHDRALNDYDVKMKWWKQTGASRGEPQPEKTVATVVSSCAVPENNPRGGLLHRYVAREQVLSWMQWDSPDQIDALVTECREHGGAFALRALGALLEGVTREYWRQRNVLQPKQGMVCPSGSARDEARHLWQTALQLGQKAVDLGNLGLGYETIEWAISTAPDPPEDHTSEEWHSRETTFAALDHLARSGICYAQLWLGDLHYTGTNRFPRDFQKAADWFRRAGGQETGVVASNSFSASRAAYRLGYLYFYGQGVEKDKVKARDCFSRAVELGVGHSEAEKALRCLQPLQWTDRWIRLRPPGRMWQDRTTIYTDPRFAYPRGCFY